MLPLYVGLLDTLEEQTKFEKIYIKYSKMMKHIAQGILHDDALSEDAVHNAFIKLTRHMSKVGEVDSAKTKGLAVIVIRNVAIDMYRKRKREVSTGSEEETLTFANKDMTQKNMEAEIVSDAIGKLAPIYRDVLLLKFIHGYDDREIASLLNVNHATVRKRQQRAKEKLAEILRDEEGFYV